MEMVWVGLLVFMVFGGSGDVSLLVFVFVFCDGVLDIPGYRLTI